MTNDSFLQWDPAQVSAYIGLLLEESQRGVALSFIDHNIEGSLLPYVTTDHLKELGIAHLGTRLAIKRAIADLISAHYEKNPPTLLNDPEYRLNNVNVNNNYVSLESLTLSTVLMKDMLKKLTTIVQQQLHPADLPLSPSQQLDLRKLNDNFTKLKTDLIPVIRLLKDLKPLPTPTLDPGPAAVHMELPTYSILSTSSTTDPVTEQPQERITRSNSINTVHKNVGSSLPSPTFSNRFSSGSLLSMGTGKIVQQQITKVNQLEVKLPGSNTLRNASSRPKLVESKSSGGPLSPAFSHHNENDDSTLNGSNTSQNKPTLKHHGSQTSTHTVTTGALPTPTPASNEPLKQLRASSEDSCLKILQQAMKRHHIPRNDWSKYVLVVCYGDKERILKLAEKPVLIFKELQELGKHPAIMLRQLAAVTERPEDSSLYDDSRIGDDIPGGTL